MPDVPAPGRRVDADATVYARNGDIRSPMCAFGNSYITDKLGADRYGDLALPRFRGLRGSGGQYAYEALKLVDGRRTVSDTRAWLTAELGPVLIDSEREYLRARADIDVVAVVAAAE